MEQMKTKRFALLLACIICTTVLVLFYGDPQPSIHHYITETQTRIVHWKNFQVEQNFRKMPEPEEKYLKDLGFNVDVPRLYPKSVWTNVTLPVFVTAISPNTAHYFVGFFKSYQHFFPDNLLVVYDLGLKPADFSLVNGICNSSNCVLRNFNYDEYPSHVENLHLSAYRPIIIQQVLNEAGAVIFIDISYTFTSNDIQVILNRAMKEGIIAWTINQPTSALTHPRMFDYFHTQKEHYYFQRMVQPYHIILYNIHSIHFHLMLPWVKCALVQNCIAPIGAQDSGCRFDKKPLYRYSGCHRYDMSALNAALGLMFKNSASRYAAREEEKFFHRVDLNKLLELGSDKNSTTINDSN